MIFDYEEPINKKIFDFNLKPKNILFVEIERLIFEVFSFMSKIEKKKCQQFFDLVKLKL